MCAKSDEINAMEKNKVDGKMEGSCEWGVGMRRGVWGVGCGAWGGGGGGRDSAKERLGLEQRQGRRQKGPGGTCLMCWRSAWRLVWQEPNEPGGD